MYKWIIAILIIVLGVMFYNNNRKVEGYERMNPAEAKEQLQENHDTVLLDVRTKEEYEEKHIEGSILIPLNLLEQGVKTKIPNKEEKIIVYCRSGNRSKTAVNLLLSMGYKEVYDLGGINSWPYEVVTGSSKR